MPYHKRYLWGPKLIQELSGTARRFVLAKNPTWVSCPGGVQVLLDHLRQHLGFPQMSEMSDFMAKYLLLSEVNHSSIDTINRAKRLWDQAKGMKDHKVRIHKIPLGEMVARAWCDAAAHNRPDGSSTQGIVVSISFKDLVKGQCAPVSLAMWQSATICRICRSPGAREAITAVNAEDLLFFARFQLSEMSGHKVHTRRVNRAVNTVPGCLVTDCQNVYDKLASEAVVPKGAERRTDNELMSLKAAQLRNNVLVRWVNSGAQLANPLTKARELREMLFYRLNHHWKIVEDETMSSAKTRKLKGQSPLEDTKVPHTSTPSVHSTYRSDS